MKCGNKQEHARDDVFPRFGRAMTYLTDQQVRGAHDSIKPGVERSGTPGDGSIKNGEPAEAGGSRCDCKTSLPDPLPPAPRAWIIFRDVFPGLTPRALR